MHHISCRKIEWLNTPDNIKSPDAFEVHKPIALSLPAVPDKGMFDVFITMAAHPHNFVVSIFCKHFYLSLAIKVIFTDISIIYILAILLTVFLLSVKISYVVKFAEIF